jgi:hypothetical protein
MAIGEFAIDFIKDKQASSGTFPIQYVNQEFHSTCSPDADRRGPRQKVIAYSMYGDFSRTDVVHKYLKPFKETINMIPLIYPGIY